MASELQFSLGRVNAAKLDLDLRAALGARVAGVATGPDGARVVFVSPPTAAEQQQAAAIVAAHDPDALTPEQQQTATLRQAEADARPKALAVLADLTDNWPALTAAQKVDVVRTALVWLVYREMRRG